MRKSPHKLACFVAAWAITVAAGAAKLWHYGSASGAPAHAPISWPKETLLPKGPLPTLILALHPQCPCSRATVGELARLMAGCQGKLNARVIMLCPAGKPAGWEGTGLWSDSAAIPGVVVTVDPDGQDARRFGAATSGQALLYSADGRLLFAGGITESRGHAGDNAGRSAIAALVLGAGVVPVNG